MKVLIGILNHNLINTIYSRHFFILEKFPVIIIEMSQIICSCPYVWTLSELIFKEHTSIFLSVLNFLENMSWKIWIIFSHAMFSISFTMHNVQICKELMLKHICIFIFCCLLWIGMYQLELLFDICVRAKGLF